MKQPKMSLLSAGATEASHRPETFGILWNEKVGWKLSNIVQRAVWYYRGLEFYNA